MGPTRLVFSIAAVLMLGVGLVLGRMSAGPRPAGHGGGPGGPGGPSPGGGRGWFVDQLDLSAEQRRQMDAIWADTRAQVGKTWEQKRELDRKRDTAVRALLTEPQRAAFDGVWADYRSARSALDGDRDRLFRDANDRSKALLTEPQKVRWEAMGKEMHDRREGEHREGDRRDGRPPRPPGMPPSPPPASNESR